MGCREFLWQTAHIHCSIASPKGLVASRISPTGRDQSALHSAIGTWQSRSANQHGQETCQSSWCDVDCRGAGNFSGGQMMKMNSKRFLTATYCDDIRNEVGNKLSLMGCYQGDLQVQTVPAMLPKLCVFASIVTPKERPFKSLTLRIVLDNDQELARMEVPEAGLAEAAENNDETSTRRTFNAAIAFAPFVIEKPMSIRVVATTEDGEMIGPRLQIKVLPQQTPAFQDGDMSKNPERPTVKKKDSARKRAAGKTTST